MSGMTTTHAWARTKEVASGPAVAGLALLPLTWLRRIRDRRQLMRLMEQPEYLLKDVGLQRDEIVRESIKRFWVA